MTNNSSSVSRLEAQGRALATKYLETVQTAAILRPLMEDQEIREALHNTYAAHAHDHLIFKLLYAVIQNLCNLTLDRDTRSLSLRSVLDEINEDSVSSALRFAFSKPLPIKGMTFMFQQMSEKEREAYIAQRQDKYRTEQEGRFDEILKSVNERAHLLFDSELAIKLNRARNKVISHYDKAPVGQEAALVTIEEMGLKWGDHQRFLNDCRDVIFDTVLLLTRGSYDLDTFAEMHAMYADDFWNHWRQGWSGSSRPKAVP